MCASRGVPRFPWILALALLVAVSAPPEAINATPASVYRVSPAIDGSIIGASLLAIAIPYAFAGSFIHPRCPCAANEVNQLDRHVIGNHNKLHDDASDATAGIVMAAPLLLDGLDVGCRGPSSKTPPCTARRWP